MDGTEAATVSRAERRQQATNDTRASIIDAARSTILAVGSANLSTRAVAEAAEVPLSQIHYHFGSKQQLILAVLEAENRKLLDRQAAMFSGPEPLSVQWDRACDYLDVDLESGYVRILQEMVSAGWSDEDVASAVRGYVGGWFQLLSDVATRESQRLGGLGPFRPSEVAALMALPFLGAETMILLGFGEDELPARSALRKIGALIRSFEEG